MLAAHFFRVAVEQRNVLRHRRGERMMAGIPAVLLACRNSAAENPRPTGNQTGPPDIVELALLSSTHPRNTDGFLPRISQAFSHWSAANKIKSPSSIFSFSRQRRLFRVAEKFHDGRFPFAVFHLDERQAFRAETLRVFGHRLDLALRRAGEALGVERLHHAADRQSRR